MPLQTLVLQSPGVCIAMAVPFGTLVVTHTPALQANVWQAVSGGQWLL